jgi:hypothetical protein
MLAANYVAGQSLDKSIAPRKFVGGAGRLASGIDSPENGKDDNLFTWRVRAIKPESKVFWDKARHEIRGTQGTQLVYVPGQSHNATLTANQLVLNPRTGEARAEGSVRLERKGKTWSAHYMEYNFKANQFKVVHLHNPHKGQRLLHKYRHTNPNLTIHANQIDVQADRRILFHNPSLYEETVPVIFLKGNQELLLDDSHGGRKIAADYTYDNDAMSRSPFPADESVGMKNAWRRRNLRYSFEEIEMPAAGENMGLFGIGVYEEFNDWFYGGLSAYGAATGQRGGFFTGGFTGGVKKRLGGNWWTDAGIYAGAGGGGVAPQGGGLMLRPHIGLKYDFGNFALGVNYGRVNFPSGDIDSDAISVMLDIPFTSLSRNWNDSPKKADKYFGDAWANVSKHRSHISMRSRAYQISGGSKKTSGQSLDGNIGLIGVNYSYFLDNNWFVDFESAGAVSGGVDGYAELLGGLGYRLPLTSNDRLALLPSLSLGGAGGGGVDTGGGFVTRANLGLEYRLSSHMSLILDGGYLVAPDGNFKTPYAGLNLAYVMESFAEDQKGTPIFAFHDIVRTSKWRVRPAHQWYFDAQRKSSAARDMQLMGAKIDWMGGEGWYLTGQGLSAYAGEAGGYSEGLWGVGGFGPSLDNIQTYAEVLVGAGGGGGVSTGSALLFKPSIGLEFHLTPNLSLQAAGGKVIPKSGDLDSNFMEANLVYRFGAVLGDIAR